MCGGWKPEVICKRERSRSNRFVICKDVSLSSVWAWRTVRKSHLSTPRAVTRNRKERWYHLNCCSPDDMRTNISSYIQFISIEYGKNNRASYSVKAFLFRLAETPHFVVLILERDMKGTKRRPSKNMYSTIQARTDLRYDNYRCPIVKRTIRGKNRIAQTWKFHIRCNFRRVNVRGVSSHLLRRYSPLE